MPLARPSLTELIERAARDLESRLPGQDAHLRRSAARALATVNAGMAHGLYGRLDWLAAQLFPDTADSAGLAQWASIYGLTRKPAVVAQGPVTFTGGNGVAIPAGTVLQRTDGAQYTTAALATIAAGTASATVTATAAGAAGNAVAASALAVLAPIAGLTSAVTVGVGGLIGGVDVEADSALLGRLLLRIRVGPPNGKLEDYVQWALEVAGVTRAWATAAWLGLGTIGVWFVRDNAAMDATIIPSAGQVTDVQAYIDARRPKPSGVTVLAPTGVALTPTIQLTSNTAAVQTAVTAELAALVRETDLGATLLLSHIREAISRADGETDHVLTVPAANVPLTAVQAFTLGAVTWA